MSEEPREPRLDAIHVPDRPRAVVLVLHGGQQRSTQPVRNRNASWWRMLLVAKALRPTARREHLAVHLLQHRVRGWNDDHDPSPVRDARWALDRLREPHRALAGRALHVLHGPQDRWTSAALSRTFVERCRPIATEATWTALPGAGHYMLRQVSTWNGFVEDSTLRILGADARDPRDTDEPTRGPA